MIHHIHQRDNPFPSSRLYDNFIPKIFLRLIISSTRLLLVLFSFVRNVATFLLVLFLFFKFIYSHGFVRYTRLASSLSFSQRSAVLSALPLARATFPGSRHDGEIDQRFMLDALSTIARDTMRATAPGAVGEASSVNCIILFLERQKAKGKSQGT